MSLIKLANKRAIAKKVKQAIYQYAIERGLDPKQSLVLAGGAMYFHGLKDSFSDIDILHPGLKNFEKKVINGFEIDAGPIGSIVADAQKSQRKHGLTIQTPDAILSFYKQLNRPKDQEKIQFLQNHLKGLQ